MPRLGRAIRSYWFSHYPVIELVFVWRNSFKCVVIEEDGRVKHGASGSSHTLLDPTCALAQGFPSERGYVASSDPNDHTPLHLPYSLLFERFVCDVIPQKSSLVELLDRAA
jgi:hypothetical protein